uniref:Tensin 3 n=1 Tax=Neogobius melanostomus TaxID=47308 RepID=A0A8C6WZ68_9GOBI
MEEGYELDLTYITERIIAVSFPRGCSEEIYGHNLKMSRGCSSPNTLIITWSIINLSEKRGDLSKMNPKTLDTGWPDLHAPPLDKICTICKAMESWLNADPLHVVVIHCRGGKGRIGVVISSFVHFTDVSASADQALDRFAMRKYYDDKVSALMTPSQKRYVWILNSLLSGSMKINASPLFLHCVILHGIPNFDAAGVCRPYIKVYQGMQAVYSSAVYHIGPSHRGRVCIALEPAQLLKGDIMIKCYHKSELPSGREDIFRLQFHTGAVQGYNLMFEKEDMETANKDRRFPDYGKVELVFSEGPERIPGADRWQNGADVIVDYNTADPLTRWDSYQNICDGEGTVDKATYKRRDPSGAEPPLGRGARTTSATSSPDHSDHALSVSSDSGLSSTSLWADKPATVASGTIRPNQGPSQLEKVQLKRLLSGFGLEDPGAEEMDDRGAVVQQTRETDILDDEVITGHDFHSVDSLGTLSSSCHKSSQNSLLSDGFGSPGGEDHGIPVQNHIHNLTIEEYDKGYSDNRRGCLASRSNSVPSSNPSNAIPKQHVYRQGSYSTQSWVRQQQMVAAQKMAYVPEDANERFSSNKQQVSTSEPPPRDITVDPIRITPKEHATVNNNNNNKRDEEFKTLTMDIDNSIDQLNQLIMDLDPTFLKSQNSTLKRSESPHVNGSGKYANGIRFGDSKDEATLKSTQQTDYRSQGLDVDSGVEAGSDMTPPTPAFPISPPTPYDPAKHTVPLDYTHHSPPLHHPHIHPAPNGHSSPRSSQRSRMAHLALGRCPAQSFDEQEDSGLSYGTDSPLLVNAVRDRNLQVVMEGHHLPPLLPEKKRASDGEHSLGTASPALSGFSSPHSGSSLSIPFPNVLPDLSTQMSGTPLPLPDVLASKQVTVKFVQDTSKFWYKPDISRDQAISVLKDKEPGSFIVRDSHSFKGAYGLAMKVATPPPSVLQQTKKGGDLSNELVRHFLIECTQKGVRLKGCPNEPYFGSLTALVCQHSITPLALPCKLIIPDTDPLEDVMENTSQSVSNSAAELLKQGAACNVWYLGSSEMESLTGAQAVQKATTMTLHANPPVTSTVVHFKVSSQGITLTDNQRKLFFRRHYNVNTVIFCALDPQDRKIFGFVARKTGTSTDNICHLFAEHDPEQPASAIVNFVSRVMIGSHKSK